MLKKSVTICGKISRTATYVPSKSGKPEFNSIRFWVEFKKPQHTGAFCFNGATKAQVIVWQETEEIFDAFRNALVDAERLTCKDTFDLDCGFEFIHIEGRLDEGKAPGRLDNVHIDGHSCIRPLDKETYMRKVKTIEVENKRSTKTKNNTAAKFFADDDE